MKKILIITTVSGFLYQFERENVRILQELGYEVHYAANRKEKIYVYEEKEMQELGVHFHPIEIEKSPYQFEKNRKALRQLVNIIREENIQVIHCHTPVGGMLGRLAGHKCRRQNVKVIYTAHGFHFYQGAPNPQSRICYFAEKMLARFTDVLIVINEEDFLNAKRFRLKKNGCLYKIPGVGLDMEQFRPFSQDERKAAREKLGLREEDFFLLSVGELNENKNQHAVLLALDQMRKEGKNIRNLRYGICGDGCYREQMEVCISRLNLKENAVMYGYCHPIWPILGCADALIFPSRREGLGMAALEALSMGIPVIAADNRGTREYMQPGKNGYVCRWDDISGFVQAIEKIRNMDADSREKMKKNCRQSVMKFEKSNTSRIMREIYTWLDGEIMNNGRNSKNQCADECI